MFVNHPIKIVLIALSFAAAHLTAASGLLDLSQCDLNQSKQALDTQWEFSWLHLKTPQDFDTSNQPDYYFFPEVWNDGVSQKGDSLQPHGFATYRLQVLLPETDEHLALKLIHVYSAYNLWVNGELLAANGKVGTSANNSAGEWRPIIVELPKAKEIELVLQISNFQHQKGGAKESIFVGSKKMLERESQVNAAYDFLLTGGYLLTGLFFLSSFLFLGRSKLSLYFSLFCLTFAYRIIGSDGYAVFLLVPNLPWQVLIRLEYIALFLAPAFFGLFTLRLFPYEANRTLLTSFAYLCYLLAGLTVVLPIPFFTHFTIPFLITLLPLIAYAGYVFFRAYKDQRSAAKLAILSGVVVFVLFTYKILIFIFTVPENEFFTFLGFMLFLFFESLILFHLFTNSLKRAKEAAEKASQSKSTFLSMMSHEIRTPMNAVIGLTNFIMDDNPKKEHLETLNTLRFSAQNLLVIINDILDLSKIEAQKIEFEKRPVNLFELAKSLKRVFSPIARQKGIYLGIDFDMRVPPFVICDPTRTSQILTNLISNAIKFTKIGGVDVIVELMSKEGNEIRLKFSIKDSGIGIPADKVASIFDSFTQASSATTREFGGTGLGLTITKNLLQLQDVQLKLESKEGVGTTFFFEQTFEVSTKEQIKKQLDPENEAPIHFDGEILLVEDNPINVMVAKKFLYKWGATVTVAENGQEALDITLDKNFDVILMDLQMPVMDGYQAVAALRKRGLKTPIIALTASALLDEQNKIFNAGMDDFVIKPFDPNVLVSKIIKYIKADELES